MDSWAGNCVICGQQFEVIARRNAPPTTTHTFSTITCERHRLTRAEIGRLQRPDWRPVWEEIRRAKLGSL
jgi:hypothetical protein